MTGGVHEPDLRRVLRAETSTLHDSLHRHSAFAALAAGTIGREAYLQLMARLSGFYRVADARLRAACDALGVEPGEYAYVPRSRSFASGRGMVMPSAPPPCPGWDRGARWPARPMSWTGH